LKKHRWFCFHTHDSIMPITILPIHNYFDNNIIIDHNFAYCTKKLCCVSCLSSLYLVSLLWKFYFSLKAHIFWFILYPKKLPKWKLCWLAFFSSFFFDKMCVWKIADKRFTRLINFILFQLCCCYCYKSLLWSLHIIE
jgi:hypothetical protein